MFTSDVIVVGAGPAGIAAAAAVARQDVRTALADDGRNEAGRPGEGLAPAGAEALARLGWQDVLKSADAARPYLGVKAIWASGIPEFSDDQLRTPVRGAILDRAVFDQELLSRAIGQGVEYLGQLSIASARTTRDGVVLEGIRAGRPWHGAAKFVIDATGKRARIARALGARRRRVTSQAATTMSLPPSPLPHPHDCWLWIEADTGGWWYGATGPDGRRHLVRFTAGKTATGAEVSRASDPGSAISESLRRTRMMRSFVTPEEVLGCKHRQFDAGCSLLDAAGGPRWMAVGEAAAAFDPVASQGLTHAFGSAHAAAAAATRALTGHLDGVADYIRRTLLTMECHVRELRNHWSTCNAPLGG